MSPSTPKAESWSHRTSVERGELWCQVIAWHPTEIKGPTDLTGPSLRKALLRRVNVVRVSGDGLTHAREKPCLFKYIRSKPPDIHGIHSLPRSSQSRVMAHSGSQALSFRIHPRQSPDTYSKRSFRREVLAGLGLAN